MKALTFIFLFIGVTTTVISQNNFREGFIVKNNNDTVKGIVEYNSNVTNSKYCYFKPSESEKKVRHIPFEIKAYGFNNGRFYESKRILWEKDSINVFLECLVSGKINLYKYKSNYFVNKENEFYDITEKKIKIKDEYGSEYVKTSNRNRGLLSFLMSDNKKLAKKVNTISFSHKSLTKIVDKYNQNKKSSSKTYNNTLPFFKLNLGLITSLNRSKIDFSSNGSIYDYLTTGDYNVTYLSYGVSLDFMYPRISERFSIYSELTRNNIVYDVTTEKKSLSSIRYDNTRLDQDALKFAFGVNYHFINYKVKPFISIGGGGYYNFKIDNSSKYTLKYESLNSIHSYNRYEIFEPEKVYLFLCAGLGASYEINEKLSVKATIRYDQTGSIGSYHSLSSKSNQYSFTIGAYWRL